MSALEESCYGRFRAKLRELGLPSGQRVLIGLSGGADSVALLLLFVEFREREDPSLQLLCCQLNHLLRGRESDEDEEFCRGLCARLGVPCLVSREDVRAYAAGRRLGLEAAARDVRYRFFAQAAREQAAGWVALGHHADDNAETVLQRIGRGAGARGLAGIPALRRLARGSEVRLIRPLMGHRAAELRQFLAARRQAWRTDSANLSLRFARNRLRHVVLPALEREFSGDIRSLLNRLSRCARALDDWASAQAERALAGAPVCAVEGGVSFPAEWVAGIPRALRAEMLRVLLERAGVPMGGWTEEHFAKLESLVGERHGSAALSLPRCVAQRSYGQVLISTQRRSAAGEPLAERVLAIPGVTPLGESGAMQAELLAAADLDLAHFVAGKSRDEEALDFEALRPPLFVRGGRAGDRFRPLGGPGRRKLQDFFTDRKVPPGERRRAPLVADAEGVVWVVGFRLDERVRIGPGTKKVLRLTFQRRQGEGPVGGRIDRGQGG